MTLAKNGFRILIALVLPISLFLVAMLSSGCVGTESETPNQGASGQIIKFITPEEAFDLIQENQNNPNFVIIDDRATAKFNSSHIENAISIPYGLDFADRLSKLDKNKIYLVYCPTGCGATSKTMKQLGFKEVYEIEGGLNAWMSQGLPIE